MSAKSSLKKYFLIVILTIFCSSLVGFFYLQNWLNRKTENVSSAARPAFEHVLKAYLVGKITGGYWDDEILQQSKVISKLDLSDRLDFYRELLLVCELDMSNAVLFADAVGDDILPLQNSLLGLKASERYRNLSLEEREKIDNWLIEIRNISEYRDSPWGKVR